MNRIRIIDYLKVVAIIGIVFYHLGVINNGYLGVEVFFVVSGYLFVRKCKNELTEKSFQPIKFLLNKLATFWPLIAIAGLVSLVMGYFVMLPDDYENLAQSVIASDFFLNNVLQAITTKNYWDVVNTYKPLMHTWYIGVLLQSFFVLAIVLWINAKVLKRDYSKWILLLITLVSVGIYIFPFFSDSDKFYLFPFRLFEIAAGGLTAYIPKVGIPAKNAKVLGISSFIFILITLFWGISITGKWKLLLVVLATIVTIYIYDEPGDRKRLSENAFRVITLPGKYSYDIYVWHQVIIAFLYYSFFQRLNVLMVVLTILLTAVLTFSSIVVRKKLVVLRERNKKIAVGLCVSVITCAFSMVLYLRAGVVRDVPELGIDVNNVYRGMHAEYVDIPYAWNKEFEDETKIHVLVMGNSFARDFANILNESVYTDKIEIAYVSGDNISMVKDKIGQADFVFYGTNSWDLPETLSAIPAEKLYIVGNKEFGNSNGIIYFNRNKEWYFSQRVELSENVLEENHLFKETYGEHYIDMISPLLEGNEIRVFTDDNYYISHDCRHLTEYGAKYYAKILDLSFLLTE